MSNQTTSNNSTTRQPGVISGVLLVAGTCVGAGMLALPVATGLAGFVPALFVNVLCWLFMLCTGLLFMEATLWMSEGANVLSMAERFFGKAGKAVGGLLFLFLYYCLLVSYISGGAPLFFKVLPAGLETSKFVAYGAFALVFGVIVFLGSHIVNRVNWILMIGLILSFILLVAIGSSEIQASFLERKNWALSLAAGPILFSAYGYHNIVPSLAIILKRNATKLRWAIVFGTLIPFIAYTLWQWMIIGSLSEQQIMTTAEQGIPITQTLQSITGHPLVSIMGAFFGFFALVTSFLGVSLSMVDFFADGLSVSREGWHRLLLCLIVFIPPTLFAAANPGIFIEAIGIAGGFGEAILNGFFPIAMVWVGRYYLNLPSAYRLPGGKALLVILTLFTALIFGLEAHHLFFGGAL